jgi:hypothetical protein
VLEIMLGSHPDALICYNDLMALGFMKEAQTLGFRLPADISVAGFDNIRFGNYTSPPLTTSTCKASAWARRRWSNCSRRSRRAGRLHQDRTAADTARLHAEPQRLNRLFFRARLYLSGEIK